MQAGRLQITSSLRQQRSSAAQHDDDVDSPGRSEEISARAPYVCVRVARYGCVCVRYQRYSAAVWERAPGVGECCMAADAGIELYSCGRAVQHKANRWLNVARLTVSILDSCNAK